MISTVEKKGRTIVPMEIRKKLGIEPGSALEWTMSQSGVSVVKLERPKSRRQGSILDALKLLGKLPVAERKHETVSTPEIDS